MELYIAEGAVHWPYFVERQAEIDAAFGPGLSWEALDAGKASRVAVYLEQADPADRKRWPQYQTWAIEQLGRFREVFQPIVQKMPP